MKNKTHLKALALCAVLFLFTVKAGLADITNGDFSAGLTGWTVEYGTVTEGPGFALFEEDLFEQSSTLTQIFTIPALALELSFDVLMSSTGTYDTAEWADAFMASLYDSSTGFPLDNNPGVDDFFYMEHTGLVETVGSFDGTKVTLDVSAFGGLDAYLVFDLWSNLYDGVETSVNLDNVNITVIPAPGALLLGLIGFSAVGLWRRSK